MSERRLRICYAVPGHHLLETAGPSRNVLSLAGELGQIADVTVAFRRVLSGAAELPFRVVEIDPAHPLPMSPSDDAAIRGSSPAALRAYLKQVRRFVDQELPRHDIWLEKSWLLSGYVCRQVARRGQTGVVVENVVRVFDEPRRSARGWIRWLRHQAIHAAVGHLLRRTPRVIAETAFLRDALQREFRLRDDQVEVIELGVDPSRFRPRDAHGARQELGIDPDDLVLLYVGTLDRTHSLEPLVAALADLDPGIRLHLVGDGPLRDTLLARASGLEGRVVHHGRVAHAEVPRFIAAADLCLAPYDLGAFPDRQMAYSTLKIPEYMASGRPVASMPSGQIQRWITHGRTGFLLENRREDWVRLLRSLPSREMLREMGAAAHASVAGLSWARAAANYLRTCQDLLGRVDDHDSGRPR